MESLRLLREVGGRSGFVASRIHIPRKLADDLQAWRLAREAETGENIAEDKRASASGIRLICKG